MTQENQGNKMLPEGESVDYNRLAREEEEREVEITEEELRGPQSLRDRMALAPNLSDMQVATLKLFPESFWIEAKRLHDLMMVSRISPDVFMSLLRILVKEIVKRSNPRLPIYVGEIVAGVYGVLSIGLDGKGRIDELELAGAAREEEELKKLGGLSPP